jgi:hypothetical protein
MSEEFVAVIGCHKPHQLLMYMVPNFATFGSLSVDILLGFLAQIILFSQVLGHQITFIAY